MTITSLVRAAALAVGLLLLVGCDTTTRSASATGRVTVNGAAAKGLYIVFSKIGDRASQAHPAAARTHKDGGFSTTMEPGEYTITAFWPQVTIEEDVSVEGEDVFRGRFCDLHQPITKVTISAGDNALPPIDLKFAVGGS